VKGASGRQTFVAVREVHAGRCHQPTADGIVGPLTWTILANSTMGDLAPASVP